MKSSYQELGGWRSRVIIVALALVTFWPTFRLGFMWDDHVMIEGNPALREWSGKTLTHDFTTDVFDGRGDRYYRPAQTILNRVDFSIWGLNPFGYHLTNWVGHAMNAVLLQELVLALGFGNLTALLAACLFAVNPMPVEQLMIIAGRAEIFGLTFTLLCLLLLLREEAWARILGYASFGIALLFKESALATPFLLALLLAYEGRPRSAYWRLWPLAVIPIPYLWARQAAVGPIIHELHWGYILQFFCQAFPQVLLIYVRLILLPWNLHSHRMMPHLSHAWPLLLTVLTGFSAYLIQKRSRLGLLGLSWFIISLLPKTPVMIYGNFMLDHWAYPASIGIFLPLAVGYSWLWQGRHTHYRYWIGMTLFPLLVCWALIVHLNVALRGTDEKMYRWALHFTTSNPIKYNLGILLLQTGRPEEALTYLLEYREAYPEDPNVQYAIAEAYWLLGHPKASNSVSSPLLLRHPEYTQRVKLYQTNRHP